LAAAPAEPSTARALHDIARLAVCTIDGAAAVGITVIGRDGTLETPAYTDERVLELDRAQAQCHEGPCIEVDEQPGPVPLTIDDMATERRWPHFAAAAERLGVRGMISCGLPLAHGGTRAALNAYAASASAFDETAAKTTALFAEYACVAFEQAFVISSLRSALESRQAIGEATGILMERHRLASHEAFQALSESSQRLNVKVRHIAQYVVRTGQSPQTIEPGDLARTA
jgi:hypothetical protein